MVRTRNRDSDLTDSWDDVSSSNYTDEGRHVRILDRKGPGDEYFEQPESPADERPTRSSASRATFVPSQDSPLRSSLRASVEPQFVMPASPNAGQRQSHSTSSSSQRMRTSVPRLRQTDRSLTSDAGFIRKQKRAATPHFRLSERSLTSDAGRFRTDEDDEDEDDGRDQRLQPASAAWHGLLRPLLSYARDVVALTLQNLKPFLGWGLLLYLLAAALIFGSGFLTNSVQHALSPICRLPFTSHLAFCPAKNLPELKGPAEFDKLVQAQDAFQEVLATVSTGSALPLDMKRGEASIRDLKHVVQYSNLPSRNELVFEFSGFIDTARQASEDLSRFNARIGRAVDHILSTNRWTLSVIDGVSASDASHGIVPRWVAQNLNIFAPFQPVSLSRDVLLDQYLRHTGAVEEQILNLITEAHALRDILDNLDGRLDVIAGISTRDGIRTEANKDELFATLWTKLGGNRNSVNKLNQQLELLKNVGAYRRVAWGHVTSTLLKLQEIQHSLEDLRERVALPEIVGTETVPLEVHIESINLGIERLEQQRDTNRRLEAESRARILKSDNDKNRRMIGEKDL